MSSGFVPSGGAVNSTQVPARAGLGARPKVPDDRSLYEVLEANKARKQAEFEQEIAERNALHKLNDDEVEYLESLEEKKRQIEKEVKSQVERDLQAFRELQKAKLAEAMKPKSAKAPTHQVESQSALSAKFAASKSGEEQLQSRFTTAKSTADTDTKEVDANKKRSREDGDDGVKSGTKESGTTDSFLSKRKKGKSSFLGTSLKASIVRKKVNNPEI